MIFSNRRIHSLGQSLDAPQCVSCECEDSFSISHLEIQFIQPEINGPNISSRQLTILPQIQFPHVLDFSSRSPYRRWPNQKKNSHFAHNLSQCKINDTPKLNPRFDVCANSKHKWQTRKKSSWIDTQTHANWNTSPSTRLWLFRAYNNNAVGSLESNADLVFNLHSWRRRPFFPLFRGPVFPLDSVDWAIFRREWRENGP